MKEKVVNTEVSINTTHLCKKNQIALLQVDLSYFDTLIGYEKAVIGRLLENEKESLERYYDSRAKWEDRAYFCHRIYSSSPDYRPVTSVFILAAMALTIIFAPVIAIFIILPVLLPFLFLPNLAKELHRIYENKANFYNGKIPYQEKLTKDLGSYEKELVPSMQWRSQMSAFRASNRHRSRAGLFSQLKPLRTIHEESHNSQQTHLVFSK